LISQPFSGNNFIKTDKSSNKNKFKFINNSGIEYFLWSGFEDAGFMVVFSTRKSGISTGEYRSLNLGFMVGDNERSVRANRLRFFKVVGVRPKDVVTATQIHGVDILNAGSSWDSQEKINPDGSVNLGTGDAILCQKPGLFAMMSYADCLPIILINPGKKSTMLLHAGRSGTYNGITSTALAAFMEKTGAEPDDIFVILGPRINECCYAVGRDVFESFSSKFGDIDGLCNVDGAVLLLDIGKINKSMLISMGITKNNIYDLNICTSCNNELFFSHRRSGGTTGRQCTLVGFIK
jgi:YfiH family protein